MAGERLLQVSSAVTEVIRSLHPELKAKIRAALDAIKKNATVGKQLKDELEGYYSFRVGRLRVIYRLTGKTIEVVAVGSRETIYKETWRRLRLGGHVHDRIAIYKRTTVKVK